MILGISVLVLIGVIAFVIIGKSIAGARPVTQNLLELGTIEMPARLKERAPQEDPDCVLFHFDRVADSIFMIGSFTPIREQLTVAVWPGPTLAPEWERRFRNLAVERVEDIDWRSEGEWEIGTGTHRVNTREHPATVLIRTFPDKGLMLGYMAWDKDASLDEAKATVERIAGSYKPALDRDGFFAIVRDRPGKIRAERRGFLAEQLAARGVSLEANEQPVEHDGIAYFLSPQWRHLDSAWFFAMTPIGTLPTSTRPFRHHRPAPPDGLWSWPDIIYYVWRDGAWQRQTIDRDFTPPPALQPWIDAQLADTSRAYFFAVHGIVVDETDTGQFGLELLWQGPPAMRTLLAEGKLVYPLE